MRYCIDFKGDAIGPGQYLACDRSSHTARKRQDARASLSLTRQEAQCHGVPSTVL